MSQKWYDVWKYVGRIALPACAASVLSLADVWKISYAKEIADTMVIAATLINSLLQIDSNKYFADKEIIEK